ncbi:hypothetical protein MTBGP_09500 [Moorella thermoacetica]|uniref:type II toxin-antitoxin system PemK/MazF family toxin n=1 Tax=Neomoorella thermoacetica TaxID=1525 RepID=UPI0030D525B7
MSPEIDQYKSRRELIDNREFQIGEIYLINDGHISIPQADRLKGGRKYHHLRPVVIIHNNEENINPLCPTVMIAPLSSRTDLKRPFDLPIFKDTDGVEEDCLIQLNLSQPVLKVDLSDCLGQISMDKIKELIALQRIMVNR